MKKYLLITAAFLTVLISACQGTVDPDADKQPSAGEGSTSELVGTIMIQVDKDVIKADGKYVAQLAVLLTDHKGVEHDVTEDVEIYCEGSDTPMTSSKFTTTTQGEYRFYALRGFDMSNTVSVRAVDGVPDLPSDPQEENVSFAHRMLLIQHTGSECPNCPKLMNILKQISADQDYSERYHHVASHSYNSSDNAYSASALTLSKALNTSLNYPMLTYNLTTEVGYLDDEIRASILSLSKDVADASIAAAAAYVDGKVYANISLKSAVDSKYRIAVWLLEDNIRSPQSGASADWHNMHDNCLRLMNGDDKNKQIYGKPIGAVQAGQTCDMIAVLDVDEDWVPQNCELMIVAVSGNGDYELVNCTYCPVGGSVSYDYL